jgi:YfiH family protein
MNASFRNEMHARIEMLAAPEPAIAANGVQLLKISAWENASQAGGDWLWHGFSTRRGGLSRAYCSEDAQGELNLGFTAADERETVAANRRLLAEAVTGSADTPLVTLRQIHSSVVLTCAGKDAGTGQASEGDGLMTDEPGLLLGVQTADCIPVLVADRKRRVVAAFHAGWRGTVKRIVEAGVGRMRLEYGSQPEDLTAAIGPGIGVCCYAVGDEVLSSFESQFIYASELFRRVYEAEPAGVPGHSDLGPSLHVDLVEANRRQLLAAGLTAEAIHATGGCTSCHRELFFSHRASQGHAGRMMSVIGIRKKNA